jgi:uncharacterized protein YndB with AHSA1/START domain
MTSEAIIIRRYAHPLDHVYQAWTRPAHMEQWFRPFDDVTMKVITFDLREGGEYFFRYTWPQGEFPLKGKFLTVRPRECLIFTWTPQPPDVDAGKDTMVSVFFRPIHAQETEVEVRHTQFPDEPMRRRHLEGWSATVDRLGRNL